jgi:DNA primase
MLTFAIKRKGKWVDLDHVWEKVARDAGKKLSRADAEKLLGSLGKRGLIEEREGEYSIADAGRKWFERRWRKVKDEINQDYLKVYRAKRYYPRVMDAFLEFCRDRYVSVFRLFTGRAWLQRKLGKRYITLKSERDVWRWLNVHGIDFIPYFHRVGKDRPDWLVIDFDAGEKVPMDQTKEVVRAAHEVLGDYGVKPAMKFSGSRGFQVWARFRPHELPRNYVPIKLKSERRKQNLFTFYSDLVRFVEAQVADRLPGLTTSEVAHKEARVDKVLLDSSIIKPMGDIRAPYSMHYKTGLISVPLGLKELDRFDLKDADPDEVVKRYRKRGNEFVLKPTDGSEFFEKVVNWIKGG